MPGGELEPYRDGALERAQEALRQAGAVDTGDRWVLLSPVCPDCLGSGHTPSRTQRCATCDGLGLVSDRGAELAPGINTHGLPIGSALDYGRIAELELRIWGKMFQCKGAECSCPVHCLVHPDGMPPGYDYQHLGHRGGRTVADWSELGDS